VFALLRPQDCVTASRSLATALSGARSLAACSAHQYPIRGPCCAAYRLIVRLDRTANLPRKLSGNPNQNVDHQPDAQLLCGTLIAVERTL